MGTCPLVGWTSMSSRCHVIREHTGITCTRYHFIGTSVGMYQVLVACWHTFEGSTRYRYACRYVQVLSTVSTLWSQLTATIDSCLTLCTPTNRQWTCVDLYTTGISFVCNHTSVSCSNPRIFVPECQRSSMIMKMATRTGLFVPVNRTNINRPDRHAANMDRQTCREKWLEVILTMPRESVACSFCCTIISCG